MTKQKIKSDFKAKSKAELRERGVLVVEIPASAAEMVLTLKLNLERDKTGDVGKFHDTYIIHISKFMIARDHTLLISNPFSLQRPFGHLLFDTVSFSILYFGKQGLDTFDDGYVDGIYLLKL